MQLKKCPICRSKKISIQFKTFDRHYGFHDKSYDVFICNSCKVLFLNPMIDNEELLAMYSDDYYAYEDFKLSKRGILKGLFKKILFGEFNTSDPNFDNSLDRVVLDIGCGSGRKLFEMKRNGWDVTGVEVSKRGSDIGNKFELNIFNGTLLEAKFESNKFDYIRSNHSFEHLINPVETIEEIYRICKPSGKILIGVPNTKSFAFRLFKKFWYYTGVPFHPFNYNTDNLSILLEKKGFEITNITYKSNWQGLLGSIQIWLNDGRIKKSSEGLFINNFLMKVIFQQVARITNIFRIGDCIEITAVKV